MLRISTGRTGSSFKTLSIDYTRLTRFLGKIGFDNIQGATSAT